MDGNVLDDPAVSMPPHDREAFTDVEHPMRLRGGGSAANSLLTELALKYPDFHTEHFILTKSATPTIRVRVSHGAGVNRVEFRFTCGSVQEAVEAHDLFCLQAATARLLGRLCDKQRINEYRQMLRGVGLAHDGCNLRAAVVKISDYLRDEHARRTALHASYGPDKLPTNMRLRKIANLRVGFEKDGKDYEWGFLSKIHWHASFLCRDLLQTYVLGKRPPYHQLALPNELHPLTVTAKDLSSDVPGNFETLTALVRHDYKSTVALLEEDDMRRRGITMNPTTGHWTINITASGTRRRVFLTGFRTYESACRAADRLQVHWFGQHAVTTQPVEGPENLILMTTEEFLAAEREMLRGPPAEKSPSRWGAQARAARIKSLTERAVGEQDGDAAEQLDKMTANGFVKIFTTPEGKKLALGSGDEWLTYQELRRSGARAEQIRAGVEQYTVRGPHPYSFEGMTCHAFPDGVLDGAMFELTEQDPGGPVNGNVDMDTKAARWMEKGIGDKWPNRICASLDAGYPCLVITYDSSQRVVRAVLYRPHVFPCTLPDVQADVRFFLENVGRGKLYQGRDLQAAGLSILKPPFLEVGGRRPPRPLENAMSIQLRAPATAGPSSAEDVAASPTPLRPLATNSPNYKRPAPAGASSTATKRPALAISTEKAGGIRSYFAALPKK